MQGFIIGDGSDHYQRKSTDLKRWLNFNIIFH